MTMTYFEVAGCIVQVTTGTSTRSAHDHTISIPLTLLSLQSPHACVIRCRSVHSTVASSPKGSIVDLSSSRL